MKNLDDFLWIGGSVLIMIGVGMIYIPAAFIVAGAACIAAGVMVAKARNNVVTEPTQEQ
jgi:hypothetical protein